MVGGTTFHRRVIQREISRVSVLNLSGKVCGASALPRRSLPLTPPSLLSNRARAHNLVENRVTCLPSGARTTITRESHKQTPRDRRSSSYSHQSALLRKGMRLGGWPTFAVFAKVGLEELMPCVLRDVFMVTLPYARFSLKCLRRGGSVHAVPRKVSGFREN
jgi:hypothetical protein